MPLLKRSLAFFVRSWNIHKAKGLKHKTPEYVFNEGLNQLRYYAMKHGHRYTELKQVIIADFVPLAVSD